MLRVLVIHLDSMLFFSSLTSWLPCPYLDMFFGLVHIKCICKVYIIRQKTIPISQILYFIYRAGKTNALGFWKLSGEGIKSQHTWSQSKTIMKAFYHKHNIISPLLKARTRPLIVEMHKCFFYVCLKSLN